MGSFSAWHWIIGLVVIVLLFGAKRSPNVMGDVAKGITPEALFRHAYGGPLPPAVRMVRACERALCRPAPPPPSPAARRSSRLTQCAGVGGHTLPRGQRNDFGMSARYELAGAYSIRVRVWTVAVRMGRRAVEPGADGFRWLRLARASGGASPGQHRTVRERVAQRRVEGPVARGRSCTDPVVGRRDAGAGQASLASAQVLHRSWRLIRHGQGRAREGGKGGSSVACATGDRTGRPPRASGAGP